jgi:hypothetical protein
MDFLGYFCVCKSEFFRLTLGGFFESHPEIRFQTERTLINFLRCFRLEFRGRGPELQLQDNYVFWKISRDLQSSV